MAVEQTFAKDLSDLVVPREESPWSWASGHWCINPNKGQARILVCFLIGPVARLASRAGSCDGLPHMPSALRSTGWGK
jgi:hypothetical protein